MQKSAFQNQITWYEDRLKEHPNWHLASENVKTYLDEGKSGTRAATRPGFMRLIEDAKAGKFDLIVTREVSRFARNQADFFKYLDDLRKCNVQVYFVMEELKTLGKEEDEVRFAVFASLAQAESRKISERVRESQDTVRYNKGVLYGNGNILGYKRVRVRHTGNDVTRDKNYPTFTVEPEQAETVRKMFNWYAEGNGLKKIARLLEKEGRKTATGKENWDESNILRCLRNPMYIGKQLQCQTRVGHFLDGIRQRSEETVLIEGDFEPIVSEELYYKVQAILDERAALRAEQGAEFKEERRSQEKWVRKLECSCGSRFRHDIWGKRKDGSANDGYSCRTKATKGSTEYREREGLSITDSCSRKGIPAWHLEMIALKIFRAICGTQYQTILDTYQMIEDCYTEETAISDDDVKKLRKDIAKLEGQTSKLLDLYMEGTLSKDAFAAKNASIEQQTAILKEKLASVEAMMSGRKSYLDDLRSDNLIELLETMTNMFNFNGETIDEDFLEHYVDKVVIRSDHCYEFMINLRGDAESFEEKTALWACAPKAKKVEQTEKIQEEYYTEMFTFPVKFAEAHEYRKKFGGYVRTSQWEDLLVQVFVRK